MLCKALAVRQAYGFICPRTVAVSYKKQGTVNEIPLVHSEDGKFLLCAGSAYAISNGVPILYDDSGEGGDRSVFYENHYSGRSRLVDVKSTYLASEREALRQFVAAENIVGPTLDVGSGTGICADIVPGYLGLDFSLEALFAEGFEGYSRVAASAEAIPLPSATFQLVISFNVLEHVPRAELAFLEIDRVLQPGGYIFLKPAWNTSTIQTKLLTEREYAVLSWSDKIHKFLVPLLRTKAFKALDRFPRRMFWLLYHGLLRRKSPAALRYRSITPWLGESVVHVADSDACSQIDIFAAIQFFSSRGYELLSHKDPVAQVCAGHDILTAKKPK